MTGARRISGRAALLTAFAVAAFSLAAFSPAKPAAAQASPTEDAVRAFADRYFAAKQFRALKKAGATLEKVAATNGHYEKNGPNGFNLIIDTVLTTDGRLIMVKDEELRYSVGANNL